MTSKTKPKYELRPRGKNSSYVGLFQDDRCLCAICVNTKARALDAQLLLRAVSCHDDLVDSLKLFIRLLEHPGMFIEPRDIEKAKAAIASTKPEPAPAESEAVK